VLIEQGKTLRLGLREFAPLLVLLLLMLLLLPPVGDTSAMPLMVMISLRSFSSVLSPYINLLCRLWCDVVPCLEPMFSPPVPLVASVVIIVLSLDVTQCSTSEQNRISALQQMKQTQAGSPCSIMRTVRLTTEVVRVAREPISERLAIRRSVGFVLF